MGREGVGRSEGGGVSCNCNASAFNIRYGSHLLEGEDQGTYM